MVVTNIDERSIEKETAAVIYFHLILFIRNKFLLVKRTFIKFGRMYIFQKPDMRQEGCCRTQNFI